MSARFARSFLQAGARRAQTTAPRRVFGKRTMASEAHAPAAKSDTPWIIGSALVFGPMFLYLVSPAGRKNTQSHAVHNDKKEHPTAKTHETPAVQIQAPEFAKPILMTDDEGKVEDVSASVALSEQSDVPKDNISPEAFQATKAEAEGVDAVSSEGTDPSEIGGTSPKSHKDSLGTFKKDEEGPTEMTKPREAALEHTTPKEYAAKN